MKVSVIGAGYVGLVTGTCFSEMGHDVTCMDVDEKKIAGLRKGLIPIFEPGLVEMVEANSRQGRLKFTSDMEEAVRNGQFIFIAVGTPPMADGTADLQYVLEVARKIGAHMDRGKVVVTKSTVPVGTARKVSAAVQEALDERNSDLKFDVVSNPEFLREGSAIDDFMNPDRIVIGSDSEDALDLMKELYKSFAQDGRRIIAMSPASSEMTKYAANSMLATKISFINEMARICEAVGADIKDVRNGIGSDHRIGYQFIQPGIGYGGSCFPKDVQALISTANSHGLEPLLLQSVEEVNARQKRRLVEKMADHYNGGIEGKRFAVWGLSFKPETDDIREAPALVIIDELLNRGAEINAYDPQALDAAKAYFAGRKGLSFSENNYKALIGCDALVIVTEWRYFRDPDFDLIKKHLKEPIIFDGRNLYSFASMREQGFTYYGIGRPSPDADLRTPKNR